MDRVRKLPIYARNGVPFCWLIDPAARTLETLELDKKKTWRLTGAFADDAKVKAKPFDAVTLDLSTLWSTFKTKKKSRKRSLSSSSSQTPSRCSRSSHHDRSSHPVPTAGRGLGEGSARS